MIEPKTYYEVVCDNCGAHLFFEKEESIVMRTLEDAKEAIDYCYWKRLKNGKCYCPECINMINS